MFRKFSLADTIILAVALLSLVFSEIMYFQGEKIDALFVGIWVPSILGFGIYLKLIKRTKNG